MYRNCKLPIPCSVSAHIISYHKPNIINAQVIHLETSSNDKCFYHNWSIPFYICLIRSLVELDVSFNDLSYLPTNIGYELPNLKKLMIQLNKIRSLPSSICELKSLCYLDVHVNELHGLPAAFGRLTTLEILNLSSNFADLKELPETFGELTNLKELDLSNNQIRVLPDTFGCLDNLTKLNLEQNPLELPPAEIVNQGVQAIKTFMAKRWIDLLEEEEIKSNQGMQEQGEGGWLTRSTSWLKNVSGNVVGYIGTAVGSPMSPKSPTTDAYLNQQLWGEVGPALIRNFQVHAFLMKIVVCRYYVCC